MDLALMAATALGGAGLYLMLPRERAPLARLGLILGVMALAALFLFLVRKAAQLDASESRPPIYFYIFAAIMIGGAVGVICQPRPVYAALYFVLVTLAGAGMFVLLLAEFMAIVLVIIYAGAILVTYVFVIMLASQGSTGGAVTAPAYDRKASGGFTAVFVAFVLVGAVLQVLLPSDGRVLAASTAGNPDPTNEPKRLMAENLGMATINGAVVETRPTTMPAVVQGDDASATTVPFVRGLSGTQGGGGATNVQVLGTSLYSHYSLSLELAGVLLTIALIGAVVIARKNTTVDEPLGTGKLPSE